MTGKTEKQICRGNFWKQSMEDTGWEVYASRILCLVKHATENGVNSNAVGGFWAANCGFCRKCFAKCDNVFEENVGVRNDETEN